jgi:hypothetical protein
MSEQKHPPRAPCRLPVFIAGMRVFCTMPSLLIAKKRCECYNFQIDIFGLLKATGMGTAFRGALSYKLISV